jgi:hypothetical protein
MERIVWVLSFALLLVLLPLAGLNALELHEFTHFDKEPITAPIKVSATVGKYLYDIEGITSPHAQVRLYSTERSLDLITKANKQGFFYFYNVLTHEKSGNFCFYSTDTNNVMATPLCVEPPTPKPDEKNTLTGLVIAPSLTLDKGEFLQKDQIAVNGRTFPEAQIKIYMFENDRIRLFDLLDLIKPAWAKELPQYLISSDSEGNFSFNLPSSRSTQGNIFVGAYYNNNPSPKSHTLDFQSNPWWKWLLINILYAFKSFVNTFVSMLFSFTFLFSMQLFVIAFVLKKLLKSKNGKSGKRKSLGIDLQQS